LKKTWLRRRAYVTSTPTFFINGRKLLGAQSLDAFKAAVEQALNPQITQINPQITQIKQNTQNAGLPVLGPPKEVSIGDAPVRGSGKAPVTVVEFSDFQCPFCARAVPTLKSLMEQYPDRMPREAPVGPENQGGPV
jgi:protein-disulfide isomerase